MARLRSDIRDMQQQGAGQPLFGQPTVLNATPIEIRFTTASNDPGDGADTIRLTRYWYDAGERRIWRQCDSNNNGMFDTGDLKQLVAEHVVNAVVPDSAHPTPLFRYCYYDAAGTLHTATTVSNAADRDRIVTVQIRLLADLNPSRAPVYMDLMTTVQPRNLRQI